VDDPQLNELWRDTLAGKLSRRELLGRAAALELAAPVVSGLLAACSRGASTAATTDGGDGTPSPSGGSLPNGETPTLVLTRGAGGLLKTRSWQAPAVLNPHLAQGPSDANAASIVLEPLADIDPDGQLVPKLAAVIPSLGDGISPDGKLVTWKLKVGVTWSDGQLFTARDVKFTYDYVSNEATAATTIQYYAAIASVEVVDDHTVNVNFEQPTPDWFSPFVGVHGMILPEHLVKDSVGDKARTDPFNLKPIGTGPFRIDEFTPGEVVRYSANDRYREPGKPYFAQVELTGDGDPLNTARMVLETGEIDFAGSLQVDPAKLMQLAAGGKGALEISPFTTIQKIQINMTDPRKAVHGEKSSLSAPHPWQSDLNVRRAYALAIPRDTIATQFYDRIGQATSTVLAAPPRFVSNNTSWEYDPEQAGLLLDQVGWTKGADGIREKDGQQMSILCQTTANPLWQEQQDIIKQAFEQLGIRTETRSIEAQVFFDPAPSNPDTYKHFAADLQMFTDGPTSPYPLGYMASWYGASDNIPQRVNQWSGRNVERWTNAEYDQRYEQAQTELDPERQASLFIEMNDLVVNNVVEIPLVAYSIPAGRSQDLENVRLSPWTSELWNIADWIRKT
jgi:peptide/nickel transport system substrate-binding protein